MSSSDLLYTSIGCNASGSCLVCVTIHSERFLLFAGGCSVFAVPFDLHPLRISWALRFRPERITCIAATGPLLFTGAADGTLCCWLLEKRAVAATVRLDAAIVALSAAGAFVAVADATNSAVYIFGLAGETLQQSMRLSCGTNLVTALAISPADGGRLIVASCETDCVVYLYLVEASTGAVEWSDQLRGHEEWVTSSAFCAQPSGGFFLATASQDRSVRLWKVSSGVGLLSVAVGHDDWVSGVSFLGSDCVVSASADCSLIRYRLNSETGALDATEHIGGSSSSLWNVVAPTEDSLVASDQNGALHLWRWNQEERKWCEHSATTGHTDSVRSVCWSPDGLLLLSSSADQTTRLHCRSKEGGSWHEIGRPQVHGYPLIASSFYGDSVHLLCAAGEKALRVFEGTKMFVRRLKAFSSITAERALELERSVEIDAASVPALGLSNKAADCFADDGREPKRSQVEGYVVTRVLTAYGCSEFGTEPPLEHELANATLWPESDKLYGHVNDLLSIAINHKGNVAATTARSSNASDASLLVWRLENKRWRLSHTITGAQSLSITKSAFSPDGDWLISASRDRSLALYRVEDAAFTLVDCVQNAHSRVIWDCCWVDESTMATGSRDGEVRTWCLDRTAQKALAGQSASFGCAVTAIASAASGAFIAVGCENGAVQIVDRALRWKRLLQLPRSICSLAFCLAGSELAVGCSDGSVSVYHCTFE